MNSLLGGRDVDRDRGPRGNAGTGRRRLAYDLARVLLGRGDLVHANGEAALLEPGLGALGAPPHDAWHRAPADDLGAIGQEGNSGAEDGDEDEGEQDPRDALRGLGAVAPAATPAGEEMLRANMKRVVNALNRIMSVFTEEEMRTIAELYSKFANSMEQNIGR